MSHDDWSDDAMLDYRWDLAETKRLQRTDQERAALSRRLVRQRVRFVLRCLGLELDARAVRPMEEEI